MDNKTTLNELINAHIMRALENVHTMLVGRVEAVNTSTIDVQPVTKKILNGSSITMPLFKDVVPMIFQGGGSYEIYSISVGDYCLLFIAEDNTEKWYTGRDNAEPNEDRRFDYSDCFAFVGVNPLAAAKSIPTTTTAIGNKIIEGDYTQTGDHTQTGDLNLIGNIVVTGDIILNGRALNAYVNSHRHDSGPIPDPSP